MSFFKKMAQSFDDSKFKEGVKRTGDTFKGIFNPDHRHDDPEEKEQDAIRQQIRDSHRFNSFANIRESCHVKWHIDGHDYFWALSEILDGARDHIFILDWWLTPELYLRRPPAYYPEWRLDRLLLKKAEQGVKIYIVVYKEVTQTMTMSSAHTKHYLESLHDNIAVMRHPDHIGATDTVEFWSHHEKLVVVDNYKGCVGGLDICFGRWDTQSHPLADAHPTDFKRTLFPGQDYNDARFQDFQNVDHYASNTISVLEQPRMPWQDVHMTVVGAVALDLSQHFIERWNEVKKRKYKHDGRYDWLSLPHDIEAAPNEAVVRHPHRIAWSEIGRQFSQRWAGPDAPPPPEGGIHVANGSARIQVVRSVSDWSHGVLTEHSIQNAYIEMIKGAEHFIYIENQFFISNTEDHGPVVNRIAQALVERICQAAQSDEKFKVIVVFPEVPCFAGSVDVTSISTILAGQYRTINRGGHSIYEKIQAAGYDPEDYIRFYHLRTYDRLNAPMSFIAEVEKESGVTFDEANVAMARLWLGPEGDDNEDKVKIKSVEPTQGDPKTMGITMAEGKQDDHVREVAVPTTVEEAGEIIQRFESGAPRSDEAVADNINQHVLLDRTHLREEKWLGSEEEEKSCYVSNLVYIHSKVMIVDDRRVIMGSANLNDRSQKGDGDSEIALVVDDQDEIESVMNGDSSYKASRFAASLRRKLTRQHLGLIEPQWCLDNKQPVTSFMRPAPYPNEDEDELKLTDVVRDPLSDDFLELWQSTASTNSSVFMELWKPTPNNDIKTWTEFKEKVPKVKPNHLADESLPIDYIKEQLSKVRGFVVEAPIHFLSDEKEWTSDESIDWRGLNPTLPIYI